ncbi:MAG: tetratricopeptide repeat protein, partial [Saprospiraceae bacterium]|nr:tetratricopeptide repeat protein [Saprospiraceae bacterium]
MNDRIYVVLFLLLCGMACTDNTPAIAPAENDAGRDTLAFHYNQLGDDENHRGNYASALTYYQKSMDLALSHQDSAQYYASMLDRAMVFEKSGDHTQAIVQSKPVIDAYIRHRDSAALGRAYATVAIFYTGQQNADTARALLRKSFPLIEKHGSPIEMSAALNQMAFTYSDEQQWAMALPYLDSAWHVMLRTGIPYNK